ncbi:SDR family NAD(P)-dependent oxidoreductase [Nocardia abscessus]|uniref:SDR family NAD(P)-dependent oxidoreductase n=1 Tax=Nocardia abscessus TaxID=120957 RepID=UPI002456C7ED|nr:SDR family NAD(P)-dependent oxidoreductase [Nocardia abscessus]
MKVAIVTGCASQVGIGFATATRLATEGWSVALIDCAADPLREAAAVIASQNDVDTLPLVCDVTSADDVNRTVDLALKHFGRLDALVNNAGITAPTRFADITEAEWERIFAVDIKGVFLMTRAALPRMREQRYGRIVNVSSVAAKRGGGIVGGVHYAAAKAAVLGFTKALAREVAAEGITCNAVAPGLIDTEIAGGLAEERRQALIADIPVGRLGRKEEVAAAITFLCSDGASYITGEEIDINGGSHID